jgi:hypothetical protein
VNAGIRTSAILLLFMPSVTLAADLNGPGRFCGYSPIIDLVEGESVATLDGGIHSGSFQWTGTFGTLHVTGIGWAGKPKGRMRDKPTSKGHAFFAERRDSGKHVVAIWNRRNGAAYFHSSNRLTDDQLKAIDRVDLFDENDVYGKRDPAQSTIVPSDCKLRTVFVWE